MGSILDFEEEKAKKELNDKTPEELLAILLDDKGNPRSEFEIHL